MKKIDHLSSFVQKFSHAFAAQARRICKNAQKFRPRLNGAPMKKTAAAFKRQLSACSAVIRRNWDTVRYYGALVLVLAVLATVSYTYRSGSSLSRPNVDPTSAPDSMVAAQAKPEPTPEPTTQPQLCWPVEGEVTGSFCADSLEWNEELGQWQTHPAIDIAAGAGEAVLAIADGTVLDAYLDPLYGNTIVIDHGEGRTVRYGSLNTLQLVATGQSVAAGEIISSVGICPAEENQGTHLHVEYYKDGAASDITLLLNE